MSKFKMLLLLLAAWIAGALAASSCPSSAPYWDQVSAACVATCPVPGYPNGLPSFPDAGFVCRVVCPMVAPYNYSGGCFPLATSTVKLLVQAPAVGAPVFLGQPTSLSYACVAGQSDACEANLVFELALTAGGPTLVSLGGERTPYGYNGASTGCWRGCLVEVYRVITSFTMPVTVAPGTYVLRVKRTIVTCPPPGTCMMAAAGGWNPAIGATFITEVPIHVVASGAYSQPPIPSPPPPTPSPTPHSSQPISTPPPSQPPPSQPPPTLLGAPPTPTPMSFAPPPPSDLPETTEPPAWSKTQIVFVIIGVVVSSFVGAALAVLICKCRARKAIQGPIVSEDASALAKKPKDSKEPALHGAGPSAPPLLVAHTLILLDGNTEAKEAMNAIEGSTAGSEDLCIVCMENKISTTFFPCMHSVCCNDCVLRLRYDHGHRFPCPMCRRPTSSVATGEDSPSAPKH